MTELVCVLAAVVLLLLGALKVQGRRHRSRSADLVTLALAAGEQTRRYRRMYHNTRRELFDTRRQTNEAALGIGPAPMNHRYTPARVVRGASTTGGRDDAGLSAAGRARLLAEFDRVIRGEPADGHQPEL